MDWRRSNSDFERAIQLSDDLVDPSAGLHDDLKREVISLIIDSEHGLKPITPL